MSAHYPSLLHTQLSKPSRPPDTAEPGKEPTAFSHAGNREKERFYVPSLLRRSDSVERPRRRNLSVQGQRHGQLQSGAPRCPGRLCSAPHSHSAAVRGPGHRLLPRHRPRLCPCRRHSPPRRNKAGGLFDGTTAGVSGSEMRARHRIQFPHPLTSRTSTHALLLIRR